MPVRGDLDSARAPFSTRTLLRMLGKPCELTIAWILASDPTTCPLLTDKRQIQDQAPREITEQVNLRLPDSVIPG